MYQLVQQGTSLGSFPCALHNPVTKSVRMGKEYWVWTKDQSPSLTCSPEGGGSDAKSARLIEAPLRMWSKKWMSTSLKKPCSVMGSIWAGLMGVLASLWLPLCLDPSLAGVCMALAADLVTTALTGIHKNVGFVPTMQAQSPL